jgi:hypothetical protein
MQLQFAFKQKISAYNYMPGQTAMFSQIAVSGQIAGLPGFPAQFLSPGLI